MEEPSEQSEQKIINYNESIPQQSHVLPPPPPPPLPSLPPPLPSLPPPLQPLPPPPPPPPPPHTFPFPISQLENNATSQPHSKDGEQAYLHSQRIDYPTSSAGFLTELCNTKTNANNYDQELPCNTSQSQLSYPQGQSSSQSLLSQTYSSQTVSCSNQFANTSNSQFRHSSTTLQDHCGIDSSAAYHSNTSYVMHPIFQIPQHSNAQIRPGAHQAHPDICPVCDHNYSISSSDWQRDFFRDQSRQNNLPDSLQQHVIALTSDSKAKQQQQQQPHYDNFQQIHTRQHTAAFRFCEYRPNEGELIHSATPEAIKPRSVHLNQQRSPKDISHAEINERQREQYTQQLEIYHELPENLKHQQSVLYQNEQGQNLVQLWHQKNKLWKDISAFSDRSERCKHLNFGQPPRKTKSQGDELQLKMVALSLSFLNETADSMKKTTLCRQDLNATGPPCGRLHCGYCSRANQRKSCPSCLAWVRMARRVCVCGESLISCEPSHLTPPLALRDKGVSTCVQAIEKHLNGMTQHRFGQAFAFYSARDGASQGRSEVGMIASYCNDFFITNINGKVIYDVTPSLHPECDLPDIHNELSNSACAFWKRHLEELRSKIQSSFHDISQLLAEHSAIKHGCLTSLTDIARRLGNSTNVKINAIPNTTPKRQHDESSSSCVDTKRPYTEQDSLNSSFSTFLQNNQERQSSPQLHQNNEQSAIDRSNLAPEIQVGGQMLAPSPKSIKNVSH
eukprot:gene5171-7017_t